MGRFFSFFRQAAATIPEAFFETLPEFPVYSWDASCPAGPFASRDEPASDMLWIWVLNAPVSPQVPHAREELKAPLPRLLWLPRDAENLAPPQ